MIKMAVLCATMHQTDFSKVKQMNITTDAIIANQAESNFLWEMKTDKITVKLVTTNTRSVGVNRNIALTNADCADVYLIADDDMVYRDGYEEIVNRAFLTCSDADAIIFNIETIGRQMGGRNSRRSKRIRFYNCLNYGAVRIAVKANKIKENNITFSTLFGGGAPYSSGEDSVFICDMLRSKMKIYTYPETIADIYQEDSSWFCGYNKKYLYDKGALYCAISKKWSKLLCLQDLARHPYIYKEQKLSLFEALKIMKQGIKGFEQGKAYKE